MGSNRRYGEAGLQRGINEAVTRPRPVSLTKDEVDADHNPVTTSTEGIPVEAWVRYPEVAIRVTGRAIAWTARAVKLEIDNPGGGTAVAWVWASSVDRK